MKIHWPPAWLLVLIGLVLNILAILLSSIVLEDLGSQMSDLDEQKQENRYSIQLAWNRVETLERKKELLTLYFSNDLRGQAPELNSPLSGQTPSPLSGQTPLFEALERELSRQLSDWVGDELPELQVTHLHQIMSLIEQAQKEQREYIDEVYLQNLTINEGLVSLDKRIAWYRSIGLFLQVFGLALILARDLAR
ncbi:DNA mismatch repair protein [Vibrio panuliri]|uniref:DNA mismatch repair protein n=2 Tax=Vibrio panuliri TaxID=1381081 RepID=A0ABX3FF29_9VIBR|nr:hypothetical protein [Vibrio panuliri]KAB1458117.1 DNA mismatch repair protein [Vibrio panuliri]OLQ89499.1 hypothetical protein BIY20_01765 [Vibrio panuliri]